MSFPKSNLLSELYSSGLNRASGRFPFYAIIKGVVGQGLSTLSESKYTRAGRIGVVVVESKYTRVGYIRVVIIKSKYTKVKVVISRIEL